MLRSLNQIRTELPKCSGVRLHLNTLLVLWLNGEIHFKSVSMCSNNGLMLKLAHNGAVCVRYPGYKVKTFS